MLPAPAVRQLKYLTAFFLSDRTDLCTKLRAILSRISYAAMACIRNDTVPLVSIWQGDLDNIHTWHISSKSPSDTSAAAASTLPAVYQFPSHRP